MNSFVALWRMAVLGAVGVEVAPELAAAVALILATVGTWLAPPNSTEE
jgi:hypothetical protein